MNISVRSARKEDIPALTALEKECFSSPWSEDSFVSFMDNGCSHCIVAEVGGKIVGYVGMNLILGEGEITNLAVTASHRRMGIGAMLMERLMNTDLLERIMLDVRISNTSAIALYEKLGFTVDGTRKGFYQKPKEDAILMSRNI